MLNDLIILDNGSDHVLRVRNPTRPTILVHSSTISGTLLAQEGYNTDLNFNNNGLITSGDIIYFSIDGTDGANDKSTVLKYDLTTSVLSVVIANATILAATGNSDAILDDICLAPDGFIYGVESVTDNVLKMNPSTGTVSIFTAKAAFTGLAGITSVELSAGPIADAAGRLYVASDDTPPALFEINTSGTPRVVINNTLNDPDTYLAIHPDNGDILVVDDVSLDKVFRVTRAGVISTFLSKAQIEAVSGASADLEGGIDFRGRSFYLAEENEDIVMKFDIDEHGNYDGNGSIYLTKASVQTATGIAPDYDGAIKFFPGVSSNLTADIVWSVTATVTYTNRTIATYSAIYDQGSRGIHVREIGDRSIFVPSNSPVKTTESFLRFQEQLGLLEANQVQPAINYWAMQTSNVNNINWRFSAVTPSGGTINVAGSSDEASPQVISNDLETVKNLLNNSLPFEDYLEIMI